MEHSGHNGPKLLLLLLGEAETRQGLLCGVKEHAVIHAGDIQRAACEANTTFFTD